MEIMGWFLVGFILGLLVRDVGGALTSCVLLGIRTRQRKRDIQETIKQLEDHINEEDKV